MHLFNIKQKLRGKAIVGVDEFEALSDISSISGSESEGSDYEKRFSSSSENEEAVANRKVPKMPKIAFELVDKNYLVMQRCILHGKKVRII